MYEKGENDTTKQNKTQKNHIMKYLINISNAGGVNDIFLTPNKTMMNMLPCTQQSGIPHAVITGNDDTEVLLPKKPSSCLDVTHTIWPDWSQVVRQIYEKNKRKEWNMEWEEEKRNSTMRFIQRIHTNGERSSPLLGNIGSETLFAGA